MLRNSRVRLAVVAGGVLLMVACFLAAVAGVWLLSIAVANIVGDRVLTLLVVPLTALAIVTAGSSWIRRIRASAAESWSSLLVVEVVVLGALTFAGRNGLTPAVLDAWALATVVVAPWWLLAMWLGGARTRRRAHRAP